MKIKKILVIVAIIAVVGVAFVFKSSQRANPDVVTQGLVFILWQGTLCR